MRFGDSFMDVELSPHKYLVHADKLKALAGGRDVFPVTVEVDPVDYCNHRCGWCVDPRHGRSSLDMETARRLFAELRDLGVMGLVYKGGGEPTLHHAFAELLDGASRFGFETGIVTNGSRLLELSEPIGSQASYVRVSVDGPTPESHRAVHGARDFDRIVAGVADVVARRGGRRHPIVGLSFAMDHSSIGLIGEAVALAERLKVDYALFRAPFYEEVGRTPTMSVEQTREVRDAFEAARRSCARGLRVLVDHWISDREAAQIDGPGADSPRRGAWMAPGANGIEHVTGRCSAAPLMAVVAADGTVYPCCNLRALDEWAIGRLDYDSGVTFRALWEGDRRRWVMAGIRRVDCIRHCTHPMSKYNEAIEYLRSPRRHAGFV